MARLPRRRSREPEDLPQLLSDDALIAWGRVLNRVPDRDWHDHPTKKAEPEPPTAIEPEPVLEPEPEPEPDPIPEPAPEPEPVLEHPPQPEPPEAVAPRPSSRLRATRRPRAWPPAGDEPDGEPEPEQLPSLDRPAPRRAPLRAAELPDARRRAPLVARGRRTAREPVNGASPAATEPGDGLTIPESVADLPPLELPDARLSPMGERLRARLSQIDDDD